MSIKQRMARVCMFLLFWVAVVNVKAGGMAYPQDKPDQPKPSAVARITAAELKAKLASNEPVVIIDVRATNSFIASNGKIKGAIHIKLRRLRARLALPPLKNVPPDREVVTYCACPNEETSIRAAEVFLAAGFKRVRALKGGWQAWLNANGQVEAKAGGK